MGRYPLGEKATILYSRQELAERLRVAWRQREENKSNIDIFLAHNTVEERCDSGMSTETNATPLPPLRIEREDSEEVSVEIKEPYKDVVDKAKEEVLQFEEFQKPKGHTFQTWFTSFDSTDSAILNIPDDLNQYSDVDDIEAEENKENGETSEEEEKDTYDAPVMIEKKSSISINWNKPVTTNNNNDSTNENEVRAPLPTSAKEPDYSQAKLKRAGFQSGMNKAFVGPILDKQTTPRITSRVSSVQEASRFRRTSSAPPQRRTQVNIVIDTPRISSRSVDNNEPERRVMSDEQTKSAVKSSITASRPIKSAPPVKRRSKSNKRRSLSMAYSKDEASMASDDGRGKARGSRSSGRSGLETKSVDVVTMVSLVSSAESESEMDENSPRDDKLICELRNKLPTTPIIKSSNGFSGGIRKPFKSGMDLIFLGALAKTVY